MIQTQSEKLLALRSLLEESEPLVHLLDSLQQLQSKYQDFTAIQFLQSEDKTHLLNMVKQIRLKDIETAVQEIRKPETIVALELGKGKGYTVFFVLVPSGLKFDWHSHPRMFGISKCISGELHVTTIDRNHMKPYKAGRFHYPREHLRSQVLKPEGESTATIDPVGFNIHRIKGVSPLSSFIDILMPDYPENFCEFFRSRREEEAFVDFKQMEDTKDQLQIWETFYQRVLRTEKSVVKNVILSFNHL